MLIRPPAGLLRLLMLLSLLLASTTPALAADGDEESTEGGESDDADKDGKTYDEMTPMEVQAEAKRLRKAIKELDRSDPVAGYGFALRREARLMVGGGLGVVSGTLLVSGLTLLANSEAKAAPLITSIGVPLGLGVVTAGLPAMILAPRFLGWYADNGPAPSSFARLKLLHRWSLEELRVRRDTALISTAFFGAATALTMGVWASRDRIGANGSAGTSGYDPGDAVTAVSFLAVTGATGAMALIWTVQYKNELTNKHRLYVMPTVSVTETISPTSTMEPGQTLGASGVQVQGGLTFVF